MFKYLIIRDAVSAGAGPAAGAARLADVASKNNPKNDPMMLNVLNMLNLAIVTHSPA